MEEITFADILAHYKLKLREAYEETEHIQSLLQSSIAEAEAGWRGTAADQFRVVLEIIRAEINKSFANLSEAQIKISAIETDILENIKQI